MDCKKCGVNKPLEQFAECQLKRQRCRTCVRDIRNRSRASTVERRLLVAFKKYCRKHGIPEHVSWTLADVEALYAKAEKVAWSKPRIARVDPEKPFIPENAKIIFYG